MSLNALFQDQHQPVNPVGIRTRRRLLGRRRQLQSLGVAASLLALSLTFGPPARAGTVNWDGTAADWFATVGGASHWIGGGFPGSGDDVRNTFLNAPMTLSANVTVNSFFSNSAFTLNGGTFSGSQANAVSTLTVNNIFTVDGGTVSNFTVQPGTKQAGGPAPSVVVTSNTSNRFNNSIINANLDFTQAGAYVLLEHFSTNTVNGNINMGTLTNGIDIHYNVSTLVLGSTGSLAGFGNVFGQGTFNNNGTVNANATGKTLFLTPGGTTNSGLMEATNGGILSLSTSFTGTGTAASGNLISSSGGGRVQVDGGNLHGTINTDASTAIAFTSSTGNILTDTTVNGNLDFTQAGAYVLLEAFNPNTVNGNINMGTLTNGIDIHYNVSTLVLGSTGSLAGFGNVFGQGGFINNGTVNANATGKTLFLTPGGTTNSGLMEAINGGILSLGGTFTGTGTAASGNLIAASGGGRVQVDGATLMGTINGVGSTALTFTGNSSNNIVGVYGNNYIPSIVNANLDLSTNNNAFLRITGPSTVSGNINLGTSAVGSGLSLFNGANLILSSTGSLTGFGNVSQDPTSIYGTTFTNNGTVNANVSGKTLTLSQSAFTNQGTTQVTSGANLVVNSASTTSGEVSVQQGGTATFNGLTQTGGLTQVDGVLNMVNSPLALSGTTKGGTLDGTGRINGNVVNTNGIVNPGDSPGTLTINGNFTQSSGGTLDIEFLGIQNGQHDLLNVLGLASLTGTLDVNYLGSGVPLTVGSQFAFLDYSTLSAPTVGGLTQYFLNETPLTNNTGTIVGHNGFTYSLLNDPTSKTLNLTVLTAGSPVPEASSATGLGILLALGLGGLIAAKRKSKA